jgi:hypothetical protein
MTFDKSFHLKRHYLVQSLQLLVDAGEAYIETGVAEQCQSLPRRGLEALC